MTRQRLATLVAVIVLSSLAAGCAPKAREKPLGLGPIGTDLTTVRKQLEGTWELVSVEVHPAEGPPSKVSARGTLVYDDFGNMEINGAITDPAVAKATDMSVLSATGRAVIDVPNQRIVFQAVEGNLKDAPPVSPDKVRRYQFQGDLLTLTSMDASGKTTAVTTWKKR
jgi:hypothetical protein